MQSGKEWLGEQIKPYKRSVITLTAASVLATCLSVAFAFLTKFLVNSATDGDKKGIVTFIVVLLAVLIFRITLQALIRFFSEKTMADISTGLRKRLFGRVLKADYKEISKYHSGDLVSRLTQDTAEISNDTVGLMPATAGMITQLIGCIGALFFIDKIFTAILIAGGVFLVAITAIFRKKLKFYQKEIMSADAENKSFMQESIVSSITIKAYGAEEKTEKKSGNILKRYYNRRIERARLNSVVGVIYSLISNSGMIFAVVWCAVGILKGSTDYGAILSVVLLMEQLQRPFTSFSSIIPVYLARQASAERLAEIDGVCTEEVKDENTEKIIKSFEGIGCENLCFSYGDEPVLKSLSFEIKKGEIALISGVSGVGKSTLFKIMLGIYTPQIGFAYVSCGGENLPLNEKTRSLFSYVPQGNFLFSGTIKENLTFFTDGAVNDCEIAETLKTCCCEFVYDLPNKLETVLGERGLGLSEGQLQRLAVARALISGRPILLLDEATSALDAETESRMLKNLSEREITCVMISHRQKAAMTCDKIIEITRETN